MSDAATIQTLHTDAQNISIVSELMYQLKVRDVMTSVVATATPQQRLRDVQHIMRDRKISGVPIVEQQRLVGIISLDDIIRALDKGEIELPVSERMTRNVATIGDHVSVVKAIDEMEKRGFGRLPVLDKQGHLTGIITHWDIVRKLIVMLQDVALQAEQRERSLAAPTVPPTDHSEVTILEFPVEKDDFENAGRASSAVKKQLQDKTHLKQLQDSQKREKELLLKVAELEEKNKQLVANKQSTKKISKEFQQTSRGLTAEDWFRKAAALWDGEKHTNPEKAIEYLDNVIKLEPNYASTYVNRGAVYSNLGQTQRAIEDFNKAIRLEPDNALAYYNRGAVYSNLGQTQRAIENYNEAIRLEPDYVSAYNNRGLAYTDLGQYQRAIEDCNEAIRLKPDHASAYNNRGVAYLIQGNKKMGCRDAQKACALGICKLLEFAKGEGLCR
ncbi:MAG TPA: tetratricopeptide repeat protein [Lentisphaeria bacterium]|nr:tetratricopeptide repeat protein [Lentisphaeria bacterium]